MNLPKARNKRRATTFIQEFLGYNHNLRTQPGEFYDMKNISMDNYPVISTRHGEADRLVLPGNPNGLHEYKESTLMAVCGTKTYVGITADDDGHEVIEEHSTGFTDSEKSFATIGAYTVVAPDMMLYDAESDSYRRIETDFRNVSLLYNHVIMLVVPCDIEGESIDYEEQPKTSPPSDTTKWWYNTTDKIWMKWSVSSERWMQIETPYVKLVPTLSASSSEYDEPSQFTEHEWEAMMRISDYFDSLKILDTISFAQKFTYDDDELTDYVIYGKGKAVAEFDPDEREVSCIVISETTLNYAGMFTLKNKCPKLNHLVALNNRVWGVDMEHNELRACKLGDPTQWFNFAGIASDSYAVSLGFKDEVTAAIEYNNYIHFFTETKIIKIYGDYPSNYQVHSMKADGVIKGGHDTLVQVEGVLFWASPVGVVAYDGSIPYFRGQKFSPDYLQGKTVAAGRDGTKYCLSVSKDGDPCGVYIYDTKKNLWCVGGDQIIKKAATMNNALCFLNNETHLVTWYDRTRTTDLKEIKGDEADDRWIEEEIEWMLETGTLGLDTPNQKFISRIQLRMDLKGTFKAEIAYDNGEYQTVLEKEHQQLHSTTIPIKVRRSDHFKIRLSGVGQIKLYSFGYETAEGSGRCLI